MPNKLDPALPTHTLENGEALSADSSTLRDYLFATTLTLFRDENNSLIERDTLESSFSEKVLDEVSKLEAVYKSAHKRSDLITQQRALERLLKVTSGLAECVSTIERAKELLPSVKKTLESTSNTPDKLHSKEDLLSVALYLEGKNRTTSGVLAALRIFESHEPPESALLPVRDLASTSGEIGLLALSILGKYRKFPEKALPLLGKAIEQTKSINEAKESLKAIYGYTILGHQKELTIDGEVLLSHLTRSRFQEASTTEKTELLKATCQVLIHHSYLAEPRDTFFKALLPEAKSARTNTSHLVSETLAILAESPEHNEELLVLGKEWMESSKKALRGRGAFLISQNPLAEYEALAGAVKFISVDDSRILSQICARMGEVEDPKAAKFLGSIVSPSGYRTNAVAASAVDALLVRREKDGERADSVILTSVMIQPVHQDLKLKVLHSLLSEDGPLGEAELAFIQVGLIATTPTNSQYNKNGGHKKFNGKIAAAALEVIEYRFYQCSSEQKELLTERVRQVATSPESDYTNATREFAERLYLKIRG